MEKMIQIHQMFEDFFFNLPDFYDKFQYIAKNIAQFCFFSYFHI